MAKSGNSKVIFVPMQLQSDVVGQMAASGSGNHGGGVGSMITSEGGDSHQGMGAVGNAGLLNSLANS